MTVKITLRGVEDLRDKLDLESAAVEPIDAGLEQLERRILQQGGGLGAKRNSLSVTTSGLARNVSSTLNWPRTTGKSWQAKNAEIARVEAPKAMDRVAQDIERRFGR